MDGKLTDVELLKNYWDVMCFGVEESRGMSRYVTRVFSSTAKYTRVGFMKKSGTNDVSIYSVYISKSKGDNPENPYDLFFEVSLKVANPYELPDTTKWTG
jgi:hypothetical protein